MIKKVTKITGRLVVEIEERYLESENQCIDLVDLLPEEYLVSSVDPEEYRRVYFKITVEVDDVVE